MSLTKYFASQLRHPSGFFGRYIVLDFLNRANYQMNALALKSLQLCPEDNVFEIGFGGGALMARMAETVTQGHITGVDFSDEAVKACTRRFNSLIKSGLIDLHCAGVEALPMAAEKFTKACAVNVIYFWADPLKALQQIHQVLRKNGLIVICFKSRSVMEKRKILLHGFALYEPDEVETLLKEAGFTDVRCNIEGNGFEQCITAEGRK